MGGDTIIYLVAPAGYPNFGDEYIAAAWLRTLARRRPTARVILDCPTPGSAAVLHHGLHPRLTVTDTLFRVVDLAREHAEPGPRHWDDVIARARDIMRDPGLAPRRAAGVRLARGADVVHLLGGGWINDLNPEHAAVAAAAAIAGCDAPAPVRAATGQGLAPGDAGAGALADVWNAFDLVETRDEASFGLVGGSAEGLEVCGGVDDAWLAIGAPDLEDNGLGHGADDARERPIGVCLQGDLLADVDGESGDEALARAAVETLRGWGAEGRDITVIEAIPGVDARVWGIVARHAPDLAGARFVPFEELWDLGLPARPGQRWLTTRFHPHLIAAARGAAGVAVDAHIEGYYTVKQQSVVAAGSGWPVSLLADAHRTPPGPGIPGDAVERNRERKLSVVDRVYPTSPVVQSAVGAVATGRRLLRGAAEMVGDAAGKMGDAAEKMGDAVGKVGDVAENAAEKIVGAGDDADDGAEE